MISVLHNGGNNQSSLRPGPNSWKGSCLVKETGDVVFIGLSQNPDTMFETKKIEFEVRVWPLESSCKTGFEYDNTSLWLP